MNKKILKFQLQVTDKLCLLLPKSTEILSVMVENNSPMLFVMVSTDDETSREFFFEVIQTNGIVSCDMGILRKFIGSFQLNNGNFSCHVFQRLD